MSDTIMKALIGLAALAFGFLWGFLVAFNVVFSDVFGVLAMAGAVAFVLVAYLVLGMVFGAVGPSTRFSFAGWLAGPGALFTLLMLSDNPSRLLYTLGVVTAVVGGTVLGIWLGASARRLVGKRHHRHHEGSGGAAPRA